MTMNDMAREKRPGKIWLIQKIIAANTLTEALKNERKAKIVEVMLTAQPGTKLEPAIGFTFRPEPGDADSE